MSSDARPLVFLVGPTAAGKSALALDLASRLDGEVVACDSMQVYRGFDIGTDKPSAKDRARIPHHLLDIVPPEAQFTAADFAARAVEAIEDIVRRGRFPLVVGGTGLYFKALEDGLFPGPGRDEILRRRLEEEAEAGGVESLWERLAALDPDYALKTGRRDKVRLIRALEVQSLTGLPLSRHFLRTRSLLAGFRVAKFGLECPRDELVRRIEARVDSMFARGLVGEVEGLLARGVPATAPPFKAIGYKEVLLHLQGTIGLPEAVGRTKVETRQYAKRQMTWFRKMRDVRWGGGEDIAAAVLDWRRPGEE
ncbi:MAG: tRNA (adenosine(37)-N6)-dimethylallyltransferase MiaA [Candidatus Aminicenantes bacterium]|nr:tRNA (adenosine(37)-N6)-dimethylallyltransferase MiaA [Candidatus Aminicenantes bacterium]